MKLKTILSTLIIWFWLISFSSAYENISLSSVLSDVPDYFTLSGLNYTISHTYNIDENVNFNTNWYWDFILWQGTNSSNTFNYIIWRIDQKLYFYSFNINTVNGYMAWNQWFFDNFCTTNDVSVRCSNFNISSYDFYNAISFNITKLYFWRVWWWWANYNPADPVWICFYNSSDELYYCSYSSWNTTYSSLTDSLWFSSLEDAQSFNWSSSPFTSSLIPEWSYLDSDYNNQDVMLSWSRLWYTKNLCYSDFSKTRLFDLSWNVSQIFDNDLEDWMWYWTWATVFDLYSWSSVSNFASFWSASINRVNSMLFTNTISNYWSGRPVWQAYLSYKLNERLEWNSNFNLTDYYQFCKFALGLSDSDRDSNYTWDKLPSDVESQLDNEKHIRICSMSWAESSAFCGWFSAWGGGWGGWSRPASISDFYDEVFNILDSRDWLNLTWDWILPYYISLGFIAFLLLYLLKR